ncbi:Bromodomain-containing protein [Backusella circina FSU 941]|nr:Bromodomain-containing protein [Backusella circina FSU 941]
MSNLAQKRPFAYFNQDDSINMNSSNDNNEYNTNIDYMNTEYNMYGGFDAYNDNTIDFTNTSTLLPTTDSMMIYNSFTPQDRSFLIDLVETLKKNKWAMAFLQPVDPESLNIPDYFDIIKKPMDLSLVSAKLKQEPCPYFSREEAINDIQLMFDNCYLYNNKTDPVCFQAKKLEEAFKKGLTKLPDKSEKVLNNQHVEMMPDDHWRRCEAIVKELRKPKHAKFTWPFLNPVDPVAAGAGDYYNIIKQPMDMSTYERKLYDFEYTSEEELVSDIRLMLSNCYTYNPPGHDIRERAIEFEKAFEDHWAKLHETGSSTSKRPSSETMQQKSKKKKNASSSSSKRQSNQPQPQLQQQQHNTSENLLLLDPTTMMLNTTGFTELPYHTSAIPPLVLSTTASPSIVTAAGAIPPPTADPPMVQTAIPLTAMPVQQQQLPQLKLHVQPQQQSSSANTTISLPTSSFSSAPVTSSPEHIVKPVEEKKQGSTILRLKLKMKQSDPEEKEVTPSISKKQVRNSGSVTTKMPSLGISKEPPKTSNATISHPSTSSKKPPLVLQNQDKWMALANKPQQRRPARPQMGQKQPQQLQQLQQQQQQQQQQQAGPTFSFDTLLDKMDEEKIQRERELQRELEREREFREQMDIKRSHDRAERLKELNNDNIDISSQKLVMKSFEMDILSLDHDFRDLVRKQRDTTNYRPLYEPEFVKRSHISLSQLKEKLLNWHHTQ